MILNHIDKEFQSSLWAAFRVVQQSYITMAEKHGEENPTAWANQQINELTNVELIDALSG
jgi:hypothetical protein